MLKRSIMIWIVFSTIGYGSVWAFDSHLDEAAGHPHVIDDAGHATDGEEDLPACDHCCHASAHTLALSPFYSNMACRGTCTGCTPYQTMIYRLPAAPPEHPPQG